MKEYISAVKARQDMSFLMEFVKMIAHLERRVMFLDVFAIEI